MSEIHSSKFIASVAKGNNNPSLAERHYVLSHATLPALIGAKLHLKSGDVYATTALDCYISAAKRGAK